MNKHFEDARHHLKRAGETVKAGLFEEFEPVREKAQDLMNREEEEPEPGRFEEVKQELKELQEKAEGETREAIAAAREKLESYRDQRAEQ
jgi:hypothetical protein